jgi:hypothetical protein
LWPCLAALLLRTWRGRTAHTFLAAGRTLSFLTGTAADRITFDGTGCCRFWSGRTSFRTVRPTAFALSRWLRPPHAVCAAAGRLLRFSPHV